MLGVQRGGLASTESAEVPGDIPVVRFPSTSVVEVMYGREG